MTMMRTETCATQRERAHDRDDAEPRQYFAEAQRQAQQRHGQQSDTNRAAASVQVERATLEMDPHLIDAHSLVCMLACAEPVHAMESASTTSCCRAFPLSAATRALCSLPLLLLLASLHLHVVSAQLMATWIQLDAVPQDDSIGGPSPRSDHTLVSLAGLSLRPNTAVPLPTVAVDPFEQTLLLYAGRGGDGTGLADAWLLNLAATPPVWSKVDSNTSASSSAATQGRWGVPLAWLPTGIDPADTGLTAVTFGGVSATPTDFDRVSTFNLQTGVWRDLMTRPAAAAATDDLFPFARGSTQLIPLPLGFGSGSAIAADAPDSGSFLMLGGFGSADGVQNSALHTDWPDAWALNISARSWTRLDSLQCARNLSTCTDETTLQTLLGNFTAASSGNLVNFTRPSRPSALVAAIAELRQAFEAFNSSIAALADAAGGCTTYCAQYAPPEDSPALYPPPLEGAAFVSVLLNSAWTGVLFGGYGCAENGAQIRGGDACYLADLWLLDYSTMSWSVRPRPWANQSDSTDYANWPPLRAYHSMIAHQQRGIIVVAGGSYLASDGRTTYYNDVRAFDLAQQLWVPVQIQGVVPTAVRGAAAALRGDTMYLHGGAGANGVVNQLFALRIGLGLTAANGYASGAGLVSSTAGTLGTFTVQMREYTSVWNESAGRSDIVWGEPASYGTGLASQLNAHLFTFVKGALVQVSATTAATPTPGLYEFSYFALFGSQYEIHLDLGGYGLPGSPWNMKLHPYNLINPAACSATAVQIVEKLGVATALLQIVDVYSNPFWDASWLQPFADPSAVQISDDGSGRLRWNGTNVYDNDGVFTFGIDVDTGDSTPAPAGAGTPVPAAAVTPLSFSAMFPAQGIIAIRYTAPALSSYRLHVRVSGVDVLGSPFTVVGLDPIALPSSLSRGLLGASISIALLCGLSSVAVHVFRTSAVMRSSSPNFLHLLNLGNAMSSLSVVALTVEGSDSACQAFHTLLSVGVVLGFGALLAKSSRVMRIFNAKQLKVQSHLSDAWLAMPLLALTALMLLINGIWIATDPQHSAELPSSNYPSVLSFKACVGRNGTKWVASLLAFFAVGLAYGGYVAVSTGHVPSKFNESKLISASVYNLFTLSLLTVPLMFFLSGSSDFLVARTVVLAAVILWCSAFPVLLLIGPKMLILSGIMNPPADAVQTTGTIAAKGSSAQGAGSTAGAMSAGPRSSVQAQRGAATTSTVSQRPSVKAVAAGSPSHAPSKLPLPPLPRPSIAASTRNSTVKPATSSSGPSASPTVGSRSPNSTDTPPTTAAGSGAAARPVSPLPLLLPSASTSSPSPPAAVDSASPVSVDSVELVPFAPLSSAPLSSSPQTHPDHPSSSESLQLSSPSASPSAAASSVTAAAPGASPLSASSMRHPRRSPSSRPQLHFTVAGSSAPASPLSPPSLRLPSPSASASRSRRLAGLLADAEGAGIGTTPAEGETAPAP